MSEYTHEDYLKNFWKKKAEQEARENTGNALFWRKARQSVSVFTDAAHDAIKQLLKVYEGYYERRTSRTEERELLIDPNQGSITKVERYDFSLNQSLLLGTRVLIDMTLQPCVTLRPQKLICNVPCCGFIYLSSIIVANVAVTVGNATDAFSYSAVAVGSHLDCPTISPANRVTIKGEYTGNRGPLSFHKHSDNFLFVATFQGPAAIVA